MHGSVINVPTNVGQTQLILSCLPHDGVIIGVLLKRHLEYKLFRMSKNVHDGDGGWMHTKVVQFLCHDVIFVECPFFRQL